MPTKIKSGTGVEINNDKRPSNQPGTYKHEASGAVLTVTSAPQADALVRLGYKLVRK